VRFDLKKKKSYIHTITDLHFDGGLTQLISFDKSVFRFISIWVHILLGTRSLEIVDPCTGGFFGIAGAKTYK
jgi:hypothetical protein